MAPQVDFISELTPVKESWSLRARVVRVWAVPDSKNLALPFSIELVLMDAKGDRIQASIRRTLMYKFKRELKEGSVYSIMYFSVAPTLDGGFKSTKHPNKINFQFGTKIFEVNDSSIPASLFSFVPISEIFGAGFNSDYLVDVMGILTIARTEREYERNGEKSKMSVIELESDGTYADELASFISSGEHENAVVLIQFAKVKTFQGKTVLQNTMYTTKLFFNLDFPEAIEFRKRFAESSESPTQLLTQLHDSSRVSISDDFLVLTARNTIEGLKDSKEEATYVVLATIKHIVDEGDWWYSACTCNKAVYPDSKLYYCEKCDQHIMNVTPRYRIKVRVIDHTDSATFVIFYRDAALLFKKSCAEMIQAAGKGVGSLTLPNEISHLVEQTFLFKVEFKDVSNSKFEQTFRVKRMTNDPNIVNRFLELGPPASGGCLAAVLPDAADVAVDLLPQFCDVIESQSACGVKNAVDLSLDSETMNAVNIQDKDVVAGNISAGSPVKGGFPADGGDGVGTFAAKKLKKDIKIEKE